MTAIALIDTTVRDGNQSLWGATGLNTGQMLQIAPVMDRVGFQAIDFITSTHMAVSVRYHKENPWERIRLMHAAMPNTPLSLLGTGMRFISWEQASDEIMALSYRLLVDNGIARFCFMDPMNDVARMCHSAHLARAEGAGDIVAALCYTESPVHDDAYFAAAAKALAASRAFDRMYLKDPGGLLKPERARTLLPALTGSVGDLPLELHSHCTVGLAPFSYLEAAAAGISTLHVAVTP